MDDAAKRPHVTDDSLLAIRVIKLEAVVGGIVAGLMSGLVVFAATNWLVLKGGDVVGPHLALLSQFFFGYRVSFFGSLIGFAYGFVFGFAGGYLVSIVYNWILLHRGHFRS
jgi:hypothetical protein